MKSKAFPIFFNALAEAGGLSSVEYLAYWGYASSAVTVITAVLSPILGISVCHIRQIYRVMLQSNSDNRNSESMLDIHCYYECDKEQFFSLCFYILIKRIIILIFCIFG